MVDATQPNDLGALISRRTLIGGAGHGSST